MGPEQFMCGNTRCLWEANHSIMVAFTPRKSIVFMIVFHVRRGVMTLGCRRDAVVLRACLWISAMCFVLWGALLKGLVKNKARQK